MKEYLDDGKGKDDNREPNIGIKLIKTFQRMTLIQEYYSQLIEDIENRIFSNYESSVYKESLTLLVFKNHIFFREMPPLQISKLDLFLFSIVIENKAKRLIKE